MKIHRVEQGTPEWLALRLGIPTASEFHKILTPKKGQLSSQTRGYAFRLVTERLLNRSLDSIEGLQWVERGKELEPEAVRMYEFENEVQTEPVGFITTDDGLIGASPDRLIIGQPAGLEIKCPAPQTHIEYMVDGFGADYRVQVQGQMLVGGFEWVDRYSFHPEMPPVKQRTERDEPFISLLEEALAEFNAMVAKMLEEVKERGFFRERARILTPAEAEYGERSGFRPTHGEGGGGDRGPRRFNNGFDPRVANSSMPFA